MTASTPPARLHPVPPAAELDATSRLLMHAAVARAGTQGYRGFTVRDLVADAGISSQTFYTRFTSKEACFVAGLQELAEAAEVHARLIIGDATDPAERLRRTITGALSLAADHPTATRVLLLESYAVGTTAQAERDRVLDATVQLVGGAAPDIVRAVLGATARVALEGCVDTTGATPSPRALAEPLAAWAATYANAALDDLPTMPAATSRRRGRAPGSLVPVGPDGSRRLRPGPKREPRAFVEHHQQDRILDGVATVVARDGFDGLTTRSLSTASEISSKAFYQHFSSLDEAFAATMLTGGRGALAAALPASMAPTDWGDGIAQGLRALLEFLAEEPAFAKVALIDALSLGTAGVAFQREAIDVLAAIIDTGYERADTTVAATVSSAVAAGAWELCADRVRRERAADLLALAPVLTVLALTPAIGITAAVRVAGRMAAATADSPT
ncbi:helix-turn-helix domain-containing protein [Baekduia sp.]|uniref:TetR/AcrR family transcriptional regulator n=1 Tax=Baekduia sp. TaxID=2600305 RepID=UPI002E0596A0|nr:helix-turn-helix domain-containing protein [Baekduia sp.]